MRLSLLAVGTSLLLASMPAAAQQGAAAGMRVAASGRATTQIAVESRAPGAERPTTSVVRIDYGQPHARGRDVAGGLIPHDQVWRTGANTSTSLATEVDLEIGNLRVPKGTYTLYSFLTRDGWRLAINKQTGQWGTQYDAAQDLGRVDMTLRQLQEPRESFTITLVPSGDSPLAGNLVLSWGTVQGTVPWRVIDPAAGASR
jgi:hypothetical protein